MDFLKELEEMKDTQPKNNNVNEGFGRSSNIYRDFFKDITKLPNIEKLIAEHGTARGHAFMVRGVDGNAYEILIHPAQYGDYFQDERKASQHRERKYKEQEKLRNKDY